MKVAGVIIAGGRSSRMGQEKALMTLGGKPVLSHIIERIAPQVFTLVINANGDATRFDGFDLEVVPDQHLDIGMPLAGLHAGLSWANDKGFDAVLTVPSDAPFIPRDLAARLGGETAAVASSGGQAHYLTGFWPTGLLNMLEASLVQGRHSRESGTSAFAEVTETKKYRVQDWVAACHARIVAWPAQPYDSFFNVNTPQDLAEAERIAAEFNP